MTGKIVILNWNGVSHLERFLPSVVQYSQGAGIVVADNGSTDNSVAFLRENYPQIELVLLDKNYGYALGYNLALKQVEADYYILLNSDVEVTPDWVYPIQQRFEIEADLSVVAPKIMSYTVRDNFEYAGACGGFIDFLGYPFCRGRILANIEQDRGQYDAPMDVFWASGACFAIRSKQFHQLGGFDPDFFAHMEEIDLCWRIQLAGGRVSVEPSSCVYHLGGGTLPNNTPHKIYLNFRNNLAMLYKNLSGRSLRPLMFIRMMLDGLSALVFLAQGRADFFREVFRAHRDYAKMKPLLHLRRQDIQQSRSAGVNTIFKGSILFQYYCMRRKKFSDLGKF